MKIKLDNRKYLKLILINNFSTLMVGFPFSLKSSPHKVPFLIILVYAVPPLLV